MSDLTRLRDHARATSAQMVADQLATGYRVRTPRDPGGTYVRMTLRVLAAAVEAGVVEVTESTERDEDGDE